MTTETDLSRAIVLALRQRGVWVIRTGVTHKRGSRGTQSGESGMPDLWTPLGWIEVKRPGEKLLASQQRWHDKARRHGVAVGVARSVGEAMALVDLWSPVRRSA